MLLEKLWIRAKKFRKSLTSNCVKFILYHRIRRTTKDLYSDHHQDVISLYDKAMSEKLKDERPESMEKLLNTFKGTRE